MRTQNGGVFGVALLILAVRAGANPGQVGDASESLPGGMPGLSMLVFVVMLWAVLSESGPMHEWANRHPAMAFIAVFLAPVVAGLVVT